MEDAWNGFRVATKNSEWKNHESKIPPQLPQFVSWTSNNWDSNPLRAAESTKETVKMEGGRELPAVQTR
jgi:hypothetical protein